MKEYFVVINGKPEGPYSTERMKELGIQPGTFVKTDGMDDYKEVHEIPELCRLLGIRSSVSQPQYFASLDVRLLAVIIDYFIIFAIYCVLAISILFFVNDKQMRIVISLAGLAIIPIVKMIYSTIMEASSKQGSYGKQLMALKVSDEQGLRITLSRSFVRNLSKIISLATLGLGYLMGFFDKRQQCLHDKIAGTLVIKERLL